MITQNAEAKNRTNAVKLLSFICPLVYFASYLTRKNYSVVMAEIITAGLLTESQAGLVESVALISYGAGQIICGILGDKLKPQRLISTGLIITALMNIAMPFCSLPALRAAVWFINGFAQSMLWPPLVRIMAETMNKSTYDKVCINVNVAGISATILLYLTSSLLWIKYYSWKYVFFSSAAVCSVIIIAWIIGFKKTGVIIKGKKEKQLEKQSGDAKPKLTPKTLVVSGFLLIALAIVAQGAIRDGVTDWVPSFIINTFKLESKSAILKSVIIPVFGVISLKIVGFINSKYVHDEVKAAFFTFGLALLCCVVLHFCYTGNQYVTLIVSAIITGLMHGVNFFLICIVPVRFEKYGIVATMSGIINSLTYVGSAAALYGFGAIAEHFSWNAVVLAWIIVAGAGTLCCMLARKPWRNFIRNA